MILWLFLAAAAPAADASEGCERGSLLCVDPEGRALAGDRLPAAVAPGARIDVKVIGCKPTSEAVFRFSAEGAGDGEQLFRAATPEPAVQGKKAMVPCQPEVLARGDVAVSTDVRVRTFSLVITREGAPGADGRRPLEIREVHAAQIHHGRYYLDIGVLFPFVVGGERRVVAEETGAAGTTRLRVQEDLDVFPALMLHVFPGGRDLAAISSFKVGAVCPGPRRFDRPSSCRAALHRRRAANALGLQVGVELDLKQRDRYFFGGIFEPVSGLSLSAGLAVTRLEYVRRGFAEGDTVPTPMTVDADGEVDLGRYTERRWAPRFYLGVSLSFDIVRTLAERRRSDAARAVLPE